ncbi:MAG: outer membrane protein assembly factor BamB family protein [Candidatus Helarchaeota archaeon]
MKIRYKSLGIIVFSIILMSCFISINNNIIIGNSVYLSDPNKWTGIQDTGIPENVEMTKTETMTVNLDPFGNILDKRITVTFSLRNLGYERVSFQIRDRIEKVKPNTFQLLRGSLEREPDVEFIDNNTYGYMIFRFKNITIGPRSREEFGYVVQTNINLSYKIRSTFYINNTRIFLNESEANPKIIAPIGSKITQVINLERVDRGLFGQNSIVHAPSIALLTVVLPYSDQEEDMDISEPEFSSAPIMENVLGFVQQISWIALTSNYTVNWSATILRGGGWGILELQPMMVVITKAADMMGSALDALTGILGIIAGLQGYWVGLVLDSIIEEFMGLSSYLQYVFETMTMELNIVNMGIYSMINNLIIALVEANIVRQFLVDSINTIDDVIDNIASSFPLDAINLINVQNTLNNSIDYISDIERRITASFGAQIIELLGNPAVITIRNMTILDIINLEYLFINATASVLPDNTTDFYTKIEIVNMTAIGGLLNLTRTYEFKLGNTTGFFYLIDEVFGNVIFTEMNVSGSPNSTAPGIYTSILNMLVPGEGSFWFTIGNISRSISTQLLLLNSSFGGKYGALIKNQSANINITPQDPFILETGFYGINGLLNSMSSIQKQFQSPYGNPTDVYLPDFSSEYSTYLTGTNTSQMDLDFLNNISFNSQLQIYMDPVLYIRNTMNFTIPYMDLSNYTSTLNYSETLPIEIADYILEDGTKPDWVNSSNDGYQSNDNTYPIFKKFIVNGACNYSKEVLVPGKYLITNFRINNTNAAKIDLEVYDNDIIIREDNLQNLFINNNTWQNFTWDLSNPDYWDYYNLNFDNDHITKFKFIFNTTEPISFDINYMNMTRTVLPYPNNISIYEGYIYSDGIEPLGNNTKYSQLNKGLKISFSFIDDICEGSEQEVIIGSTDKHIYVFDGKTGNQKWNLSLNGHIIEMNVQDFIQGGKKEIILGLDNGSILVLNGTGIRIWNYTFDNKINYLKVGDINNDTLDEIVVGANDILLVALNNTGGQMWNSSIGNTVTDIEIADVNSDSKNEVIISSFANSVKCFNGSNGNLLWKKVFDDDVLNIAVGNLTGDQYNDIVAHVKHDCLFAFSGNNASDLWNCDIGVYIYDLELLTNPNNLDNVIISIGTNITSLYGINGTEIWTRSVHSIITTMKILDVNSDSIEDIIVGSTSTNISVLNYNNSLIWEYQADRTTASIGFGDLDNNTVLDMCVGQIDNELHVVNLTIINKTWEVILGKWIVSFKFTRTGEYISIYYNLPEPISSLLQTIGLNLPDLTSLMDIGSMSSFIGTDINGLDSLSDISMNPSDLEDLGLGISLDGIGLVNLLIFELGIMTYINEMSDVAKYDKAITGVPDARNLGDDFIDYNVFINETTDGSDWKYIQCDIRNNMEEDITINYFALTLDNNGTPIPKDRITIQGINTTSGSWIDINESIIENFDWDLIGLNYINGFVIFKNYLNIGPDERKIITADWKLRQLRLKINISGLSPLNLSIQTWVDCSQEHSGIDLQPISGTVTINNIYPTVLVYEIPTITIPERVQQNLLMSILTSPVTWCFIFVAGFLSVGYNYFKKREEFRFNKIATRKLLKWLKKEQEKWDDDLLNRKMNIKKYSSLVRLRLRLKQNYYKPRDNILKFLFEFDKRLKSNKILSDIEDILFLKSFWRDINKPSKLIQIIEIVMRTIKIPLDYLLKGLFWIPKGFYKLLVLIFVKKRKIIVKKKSLIEDIDTEENNLTQNNSVNLPANNKTSSDPLKDKKSKNKQKNTNSNEDWDGEIMYDGGTKTIISKLPEIETKLGRTFYYIAKNKYIGVSLKDIAKYLGVTIHEALFYIFKLYEEGLITQIREGNIIDNDIWDISSEFKKLDPELEKIMSRINRLYEEISEGIIMTESELKEFNKDIKDDNVIKKDFEMDNLKILMPKPVKVNINLPEIDELKNKDEKKLPNAKVEKIK